jgi:hypothetical protein
MPKRLAMADTTGSTSEVTQDAPVTPPQVFISRFRSPGRANRSKKPRTKRGSGENHFSRLRHRAVRVGTAS